MIDLWSVIIFGSLIVAIIVYAAQPIKDDRYD